MTDLATTDAATQYRALINAGFNIYKVIRERAGTSALGQAAATLLLDSGSAAGATVAAGNVLAYAQGRAFYLDPADFAVTGRDSKLRVRATCITNAVAPATTWTVGLYPVSAFGGASGAYPIVNTLGAVVAGSTVAFATPASSSSGQGNSGDFAIPSAGYYVLAVVNSGAAAANSAVAILAALQLRQV